MRSNNHFSLIGHPKDIETMHNFIGAYRKNYHAKRMNDDLLYKLLEWTPSYKGFDITLQSMENRQDAHGSLYFATFFPEMLFNNREKVLNRIRQALSKSETEKASVAALGGFTSIADGQQGELVSKVVNSMAVTNGTTFTSAMVVESLKKMCALVRLDLEDAHLAIIGATGSIGRACAGYFTEKTRRLTLTGKKIEKLRAVFHDKFQEDNSSVAYTIDNKAAVKDADIVICVTSTISSIFEAEDFKSGAIVCDVGFPKNISNACAHRPDIIAYSGGMAKIPGKIEHSKVYSMPSDEILYGCFSEAIIVAMEGCFEYCTVGNADIPAANIEALAKIGFKHGFSVPEFFNDQKRYQNRDFETIEKAIKNNNN